MDFILIYFGMFCLSELSLFVLGNLFLVLPDSQKKDLRQHLKSLVGENIWHTFFFKTELMLSLTP